MLSPEVWNFVNPFFNSYNQCLSDKDVFLTLKRQLFYHHVSITLPNTLQAPKEILNCLTIDCQYYKISNVPVNEIFNLNFINLFLKKGHFTALSINTISINDDRLAVTCSGKIILILSKKSSQELGLPSTVKNFTKDQHNLFEFDFNLLTENEKKFEEIEKKLQNLKLCFDIILAWEPEDNKVCPSSVAYYFCQKNYFVKTCNILIKKHLNYNVNVPIYDEESDIEELMEWLGAFNLQCNMSDNCYISKFNCSAKCETVGQVLHISFTGFFTASRIQSLILKINEFLQENTSHWIGLVLNGFENSLLNYNNKLCVTEGHYQAFLFKTGMPNLVYFFLEKSK